MNESIDTTNNFKTQPEFSSGPKNKRRISMMTLFLILLILQVIFLLIYYAAVCRKDIENNIAEYTNETEKKLSEVVLKVQGGGNIDSVLTYADKDNMYNILVTEQSEGVVGNHLTGKIETFIFKEGEAKYLDNNYIVKVTLALDLFSMGKISALHRLASIGIGTFIFSCIIVIIYGFFTDQIRLGKTPLDEKDPSNLITIFGNEKEAEGIKDEDSKTIIAAKEEAKPDMKASVEVLGGVEYGKETEKEYTSTWADNKTGNGTYDEKEIKNISPESNNVKGTSFSNTPESSRYGYVEKEEKSSYSSISNAMTGSEKNNKSGDVYIGGNFARTGDSTSNSQHRESDFTASASEAVKNTFANIQNKKNDLLNKNNEEVKSNVIKRENKQTEEVIRGKVKDVENFLREKTRNSIVKQKVKMDNLTYEINKNLTERIQNVSFKSEVKDVNLNVDVPKIVDAIGKVITTNMKENGSDNDLKLDISCKRKENGKIIFSIKDNIKGDIDINKIFDPLYEAGNKLKDMKLATTLEIIKSHGGKIWAEKNSGDGKTIYFELDGEDEKDENK